MSDQTFVAGTSGGQTFTGRGTGNTLELSATSSLQTIDVPDGTLTGLSGADTTDYFSDIQTFDGNFGAGGTTFIAGSTGGFTFEGTGSGVNTLDFSGATSGVQIFLNPNAQGQEVAETGDGSDTFTGITTIDGSAAGGNTFFGGPGDYTIDGGGSNNTLNYASAPNPVTIDVDTGTATGGYSGTTSFSDIQTFVGSSVGGNDFIVGSGGYDFQGPNGSTNNTLDFSSAASGVQITINSSAGNGSASLTTGTDDFSNIQAFKGSTSGGTTFIVSIGEFTFTGQGSGNTLALGSTNTLVTILVGSGSVEASGGIISDSFSDIQAFEGNTGSGGTTFDAGAGNNTYEGEGTGTNTLSYAASTGTVTINTVTGTAQNGFGGTDNFSGITQFVGGGDGNTTFVAGSGTYTFTGEGSNNTLDESASTDGVAFNVSSGSGSAEPESGGDTTFSGIQIFKGSTAGDNIFTVGTGNQTLDGGGGNNEITFASDASGININVATGTATTANGTDSFSDIQIFVGSSSGSNTFIGGAGSYTFEAQGTGNELDYSNAPGAVTINTTGSGTVLPDYAQNGFGGTDYFSGIQIFKGSTDGDTTFVAGSAGGLAFTGQGAGNTLDFSGASSGVTIDLGPNAEGEETAQLGIGTDTFTGITTIKGSTAGGNTFLGGPGNYTVEGGGGNNTLSYADAANPVTIDAATGTATGAYPGTVNFTDIQTFVGSANGSNTFIVGAGSYTFESGGSTGNTIVYTPQSNDVILTSFNSSNELLDFQGFGNSLNAQDVQNDTTVSNGNTYINIPDAGTIELASYAGGISPSDMEFTAACYCRGTLIATERGEVPVEDLAIGEKVLTLSGEARPIKWIGRRSYGSRFVMGRKDVLPICIKAGALADSVPKRDLWISPNHAMYLDGVLIEAKDLVNGASIVQAERADKVEYFHLELESHEVIIAEMAPSESFIDDDSRLMFHNVHEYRLLYPDVEPGPAQYCAPRLDNGHEVEAARRRIALRAEPCSPADGAHLGKLRGFVDLVTATSIEGWAQNMDHPEAPVCLDIFAGGRLIGQVLANRYRDGLADFTHSSGRHSFVFTPPAGLVFSLDAVEVRRSLDGSVLLLTKRAKQEIAVYSAGASSAPSAAA
jgi:O-antigen biosynthesis protein